MNTNPASNNQLKEWRKLLMGKYRKKTGLFIAEGIRCVEQIITNKKVDVVELLIDKQNPPDDAEIPTNLPVYELEQGDFADVSDTETPQGIIAICKTPKETGLEKLASKEGLIVALDAIQDPGNMGTMIRTAAWFGVKAIVLGTGCVDPFHPKVVRSTAGATGVIPWLRGDLAPVFATLETAGWQVFLLDGSPNSQVLKTIKPHNKTILVAGNEANGIQRELFTAARIPVRIEGHSEIVESLNVAAALGIGLFSLSGE